MVDEAQSQSVRDSRVSRHLAYWGTDTLCLYTVVYLDVVLTLYSCYLRTTAAAGTAVFHRSVRTKIKLDRLLFCGSSGRRIARAPLEIFSRSTTITTITTAAAAATDFPSEVAAVMRE